MSGSTTAVGIMRDRYAVEVEARPSRFTDPVAYREWCERADAWAAGLEAGEGS